MFKNKSIVRLIVLIMFTMGAYTLLSTFSFTNSDFSGLAFAKNRILNGIDANFPPFSYIDKTGKPTGFDVDSLNWIAKKMGFKVTHKVVPWNMAISDLMTHKIDMIASGLSITPSRKRKVDFTIPYWGIEQVMVVRKNSNISLNTLLHNHNVIGVQRGTSESKWLNDNAKPRGWNYKLRHYISFNSAIKDLQKRKITAVAMDSVPAKNISPRKNVKILGTFGMRAEKFGYAVHKQNKPLLKKLNKGLKKLIASPYFNKLIKKYKINR